MYTVTPCNLHLFSVLQLGPTLNKPGRYLGYITVLDTVLQYPLGTFLMYNNNY